MAQHAFIGPDRHDVVLLLVSAREEHWQRTALEDCEPLSWAALADRCRTSPLIVEVPPRSTDAPRGLASIAARASEPQPTQRASGVSIRDGRRRVDASCAVRALAPSLGVPREGTAQLLPQVELRCRHFTQAASVSQAEGATQATRAKHRREGPGWAGGAVSET